MLPYLYEFHYSAGHLIFLGIFGTVAVTIFCCLGLAAFRAARHAAAARAPVAAPVQVSDDERGSAVRASS